MRPMFNNIFYHEGRLYAPDIQAGFTEELYNFSGKIYREWQATRSKLSAALAKGTRGVEIQKNSKILYLGAAHGYTPSFLSQICEDGKIFAVEFAPRVARELVMLSEKRKNILPILADANQPNLYYHMIQPVDIVYQDVAQRNQVEIFVKNCNLFLKRNGLAMVALKARSVNVAEKPAKIFADVKRELELTFRVLDYRNLEPMQKDHAFFVCQKR